MRKAWTATGIAVASLAAVAATAGPALAYQGTPDGGTCTGTGPAAAAPATGSGFGRGMGQGMGRGMGQGMGARRGAGLLTASSGTLTADQRADLVAMADEEKLAHDVYASLAATYPSIMQFPRISQAEAQHLSTVRLLLDRYGIDDPTATLPAGDFASPANDALYRDLMARATTTTAALQVGVAIEKADIADLDQAMSGLTAPDVLQAYAHLQTASERHLAAFGG